MGPTPTVHRDAEQGEDIRSTFIFEKNNERDGHSNLMCLHTQADHIYWLQDVQDDRQRVPLTMK